MGCALITIVDSSPTVSHNTDKRIHRTHGMNPMRRQGGCINLQKRLRKGRGEVLCNGLTSFYGRKGLIAAVQREKRKAT